MNKKKTNNSIFGKINLEVAFVRWKNFLIGAVVGFIGGYVTKSVVSSKVTIAPELVLRKVKKLVKENGSITGSWILMQTEQYFKNDLEYTVYKGGVTRNINGKLEQYEFIADALTGTIIDLSPAT